MQGIVIKSTGSSYMVRCDNTVFLCRLKGKIRLEGRKTTNPIAVGDVVDFELEDNNEANITKIHPRKNYIIRKSINLSKQSQIIASNLDQAGDGDTQLGLHLLQVLSQKPGVGNIYLGFVPGVPIERDRPDRVDEREAGRQVDDVLLVALVGQAGDGGGGAAQG